MAAPLASTAQLWKLPAVTATTPEPSPLTATGTFESVLDPFPTFVPQHLAAPPVVRAQLPNCPALIGLVLGLDVERLTLPVNDQRLIPLVPHDPAVVVLAMLSTVASPAYEPVTDDARNSYPYGFTELETGAPDEKPVEFTFPPDAFHLIVPDSDDGFAAEQLPVNDPLVALSLPAVTVTDAFPLWPTPHVNVAFSDRTFPACAAATNPGVYFAFPAIEHTTEPRPVTFTAAPALTGVTNSEEPTSATAPTTDTSERRTRPCPTTCSQPPCRTASPARTTCRSSGRDTPVTLVSSGR
jgi:hypothetical protein